MVLCIDLIKGYLKVFQNPHLPDNIVLQQYNGLKYSPMHAHG